MIEPDPFAGIGEALAHLRKRAGFSTQTQASEALKIDKGQLSRWENESPRPTLENLGRVLAGYGATVSDLAVALDSASTLTTAVDRGPAFEELIKSLEEAVHRVERRQVETESRLERLENDLRRMTG